MVHTAGAPESPVIASDAEDDDEVITTREPRLSQKPMKNTMEYQR